MGKILNANKAKNRISIEKLILGELDRSNDWNKICKHYILSEDILEKHFNDIDHNILCMYQNLSIDFIKKHFNNLTDRLLMNQKFDEDTLKKYIYNNFSSFSYSAEHALFRYQELSPDFILEYQKKYTLEESSYVILKYQKINTELIDSISINKNYMSKSYVIEAIRYNKILTKKQRQKYINYVERK